MENKPLRQRRRRVYAISPSYGVYWVKACFDKELAKKELLKAENAGSTILTFVEEKRKCK